jgi:pseudouridine kinase
MSFDILAIGGAHIDRRGRLFGETKPGASNPGQWFEEVGGGVFNAACNLSRLGHRVRLIAPRGGDPAGQAVTEAAQRAGLDDCPVVFLDRATPSYTAIIERDGNLVIALADMALYDIFSARRLRARSTRDSLDAAGHVLCDANLPGTTITALADETSARGIGLSAIAISPAKVLRFREALPRIDHLFLNVAEAESLTGKTADRPEDWPTLLRLAGLRGGSVTSGGRVAIAFDETSAAAIEPSPVAEIADVTGAGDAFAAGFLKARLAGGDLCEALRQAVATASITLASRHATEENLTPQRLETQLALVPRARFLP